MLNIASESVIGASLGEVAQVLVPMVLGQVLGRWRANGGAAYMGEWQRAVCAVLCLRFHYFQLSCPALFVALVRSMETRGRSKNPNNETETFPLD